MLKRGKASYSLTIETAAAVKIVQHMRRLGLARRSLSIGRVPSRPTSLRLGVRINCVATGTLRDGRSGCAILFGGWGNGRILGGEAPAHPRRTAHYA